MNRIRIATRKSPLALWQANYVKTALLQQHPGLEVELVTMSTRGDKILDTPLAKIGGKGLFIKELEVAILEDRADIAVHSMKDVPMAFPEGLGLLAVCEREDPSDAWVSNHYSSFQDLPRGAIVGTSSLRRQVQLRRIRPDIQIRDLRGNVGTRLAKLDDGNFDGIVLASAGLKRLGLANRINHAFAFDDMLPAAGQGAVGIEGRTDNPAIKHLLEPLHCQVTATRVLAERAFNERLNGGCQVPIGAFAQVQGDNLLIDGLVGSLEGNTILRQQAEGRASEAVALGAALAETLLDMGAGELLQGVTM